MHSPGFNEGDLAMVKNTRVQKFTSTYWQAIAAAVMFAVGSLSTVAVGQQRTNSVPDRVSIPSPTAPDRIRAAQRGAPATVDVAPGSPLLEEGQNNQIADLTAELEKQRAQIDALQRTVDELVRHNEPLPGYHEAFTTKGTWDKMSDEAGIRYYQRTR
jgi:predicted pyridoxine 5'-phosphate oxidase superfamily flavin-nucleotide-binding protein